MKVIKPKLLVVAGPNGSGKTTTTSQILRHEWVEGCAYINADFIARDELGNWNSPEMVLKAAQIATERRESCLKNSENLIFETVFSAPDKILYLQRAKRAGYFIRLFFVGTDNPSINASRVAQRVMEGGHDVPIPKIISRYYKSVSNCCVAATFVDRLYVYDNSVENTPAKLLFRVSNGIISKVYGEINDWALPIYESVKK